MRILLLCNGLIGELQEKYGMTPGKPESWIKGVYERMLRTPELEVMYLFPTKKQHMSFSEGNIKFQTYTQKNIAKLEAEQSEEFEKIIRSFNPDVIHIFGTEYLHTYAMLSVCEKLGCSAKTLVHIQGLVDFYSYHYLAYLSTYYTGINTLGDALRVILRKGGGARSGQKNFQKRGVYEVEAIKKARNISGRTDWDEACVKSINPNVNYFFCNEMLRDSFYDSPKWSVNSCEKHSIFISQASYPLKGFHLFLQALPEIIKKYPDVHVYTTGKSPIPNTLIGKIKQSSYQKYLAELISKHNLQSHITFTGYLDEVSMCRRFLNSHISILPSSIENSPNSLGEAMILGVPCIASDVGGVKNMLTHGTEGFTYPADEFYMIPYYVDKIFSNDELAQELSRNAIAHASRTHDRTTNFNQLMNIYHQISGA